MASKIEQIKSQIESLVKQKKFQEALKVIEDNEIKKLIDDSPIDSVRILYLVSQTFNSMAKYQDALSASERCLNILKQLPENNKKIAQIKAVRASINSNLGDLKNAELESRDASDIFRLIGDREGIIGCYNQLAQIYFIKGELNRTTEYLEAGIKCCDEIKDNKKKAALVGNLGTTYMSMGEWQLAEKNLLVARKIHEEEKDQLNLCRALLSLSYVYFSQRNLEQAKKMHERSLELIQKNNYQRELAIYHEYSGELTFTQGDYVSAKQHYLEAIRIGERIAPKSAIISQTYRLLAELYIAQKEWESALSSCEKALEVAEALGEKIEIGAIYRAFGQIYDAKGQTKKAKESFQKSASILEEMRGKRKFEKTYVEATG